MNERRSYTMTTRARSVEVTRASILDALVGLAATTPLREVGLDDVARTAGVSVQTVLRHFGNRAHLFEVATEHAKRAVEEERRAPVGDVAGAVRVLVDHYETRGRTSLLFLAQEDTEPVAARITTGGKALHRAWVAETFAPFLPQSRGNREAAIDLLVVATDVYAWKLLRLDRGLSRNQTQQRLQHLVGAVLAGLGDLEE